MHGSEPRFGRLPWLGLGKVLQDDGCEAGGPGSGAGAAGRKAMGIVIFSGLSIGTLFTLFVVPAMYLFIAARHQKEETGQADAVAPQQQVAPEA